MKTLVALCVVLGFLAVVVVGCCSGLLTSESQARGALTNAGYANLKLVHAYHFFAEWRGCGKDDDAKYVFSATNPAGKPVTVSVCEGWPFKAATIRYTG